MGCRNELVSRALADLRNLSRSLNGNFILENGLVRSVERELDVIEKSGIIQCVFSHVGEYPRLSPQHEIIVFRCVQEALNNAVKHSQCTALNVEISTIENSVSIVVTDNGKGLSASDNEGIGMNSMKQRIATLGGQMQVKSSANGTSVLFQLPNQTQT